MNEVFISYSRKDGDFVDRLIQDLEQHGTSVWIDRQDIETGDSWRGQIVDGIRNCKAFIIILSPNSVGSKNVSRELSLAESHDRMIIPIVHQACNIPSGMEYQLAELQWVNLTAMSYEEGLQRLVRVLNKPAASTDENQEKRRSETARLRQAIETAAPEPLAAIPLAPAAGSLFGRIGKSKLALAAVALLVLGAIGLFSLNSDSSSEATTESALTAAPETAAASASPLTDPLIAGLSPLAIKKLLEIKEKAELVRCSPDQTIFYLPDEDDLNALAELERRVLVWFEIPLAEFRESLKGLPLEKEENGTGYIPTRRLTTLEKKMLIGQSCGLTEHGEKASEVLLAAAAQAPQK
jgi:hypothetical protein